MTWVLLWLASSALAVTVVGAHLGVGLTAMAVRLRPWLGALGLAVAWMVVEPLEGQNDGDDPTSLLPRLFKWAFFAGTLAGLRGGERLLAIPVLVIGQGAAVAFILGPVERLVFDGAGIRAAWAFDKTTALEGYVRSAFESVWGTALDYPAGLVFDYLGVFAPWLVPAAAVALGAFAWALFRSVTAGQGALVFPTFPRVTLALLAPIAIPLWWLPGDGAAPLVVHDVARSVWLIHVIMAIVTLRRGAWAQRRGIDGAALTALLILLPDVAGLVIGLAASVRAAFTASGTRAVPALRALVGLTSPAAVMSAMAMAMVLNEVDLTVRNPQSSTAAGGTIVGRASALTPVEARAGCEALNARLCELAQFRDTADATSGGTWTWVRIPTGRLGTTIIGAAIKVSVPEVGISTLAIASPYLEVVLDDGPRTPLSALCCLGQGGAPAK